MSNNTSLQVLAVDYSRKAVKADSIKASIISHADFPKYVKMATAPKTGKASPFVVAAKAMLGIDDERGTKTGPRGEQVPTVYEPVTMPDGTRAHLTGRNVEYVVLILKEAVPSKDKADRLAITRSGETSGSLTVDPNTNLGRLMLAALAGEEIGVDGDAWEQITNALDAAGF